MEHPREVDAIREALQYLIASDMPAQHKRVLMEAVTQALRTEEAAVSHAIAERAEGGEWQAHEMRLIESTLRDKVAHGWQHADEILMRLASQLHRSPQEVRQKATQMGFGTGVDYRLAREHNLAASNARR